MKLFKIIFNVSLILSSTMVKAQILKTQMLSVGALHQQILDNPNSFFTGPNISLIDNRYAINAGALIANNRGGSKLFVSADYHILRWHHAYMAHRFTPVLGAQVVLTDIKNEIGENASSQRVALFPKAGVKASYDRFTVDVFYLKNNLEKQLQLGVSYVLWVGPHCTMKRLKEVRPTWDSKLNF